MVHVQSWQQCNKIDFISNIFYFCHVWFFSIVFFSVYLCSLFVSICFFIFVFLFCFCFRVVCGVIALGAEVICNRVPGLTSRQREMCRTSPDAMVAVGDGVRLASIECRHQFRNHRWNCTDISNSNSFGHVVTIGKFNWHFHRQRVSKLKSFKVAGCLMLMIFVEWVEC